MYTIQTNILRFNPLLFIRSERFLTRIFEFLRTWSEGDHWILSGVKGLQQINRMLEDGTLASHIPSLKGIVTEDVLKAAFRAMRADAPRGVDGQGGETARAFIRLLAEHAEEYEVDFREIIRQETLTSLIRTARRKHAWIQVLGDLAARGQLETEKVFDAENLAEVFKLFLVEEQIAGVSYLLAKEFKEVGAEGAFTPDNWKSVLKIYRDPNGRKQQVAAIILQLFISVEASFEGELKEEELRKIRGLNPDTVLEANAETAETP